MAVQIGDNECLRPVSASTMRRFAVHKENAPFLGKIGGEVCAGAIVRRHGRSSVGVPCFATGLEENEKFCDVCKDIWPEHDVNGFYVLDTEVMENAKEFYKPAKTAVLWNLPFMKNMDHFFSSEVQAVKDLLADTEAELERDWPYNSFRDVSKEILLGSGVMHRDSDKSKNAYKRDQWEMDRLSMYVREMITNWLRISAVIDTEDLMSEVGSLQRKAKLVSSASMWTVQRKHPTVPIWAGPLVPADVMLAGFRAAARSYQTLLNNVHAESESDKVDMDEFSWGQEVESLYEWAQTVERKQRPTLRSKKYVPSSQEPPRTPAKARQSPSQVRRWYAAKGTSRPGAYVHKDVAESYNREGRGTVKMFRSLARLREWLNMPSPRLYLEQDCNPAPLEDAQQQTQDEEEEEAESEEEFYALKGGKEDGLFSDMASVVEAKNRSGGAMAVFSSRKEAELYLRPTTSFVVWVGREIGIMGKKKCVKATQRLANARMSGCTIEQGVDKYSINDLEIIWNFLKNVFEMSKRLNPNSRLVVGVLCCGGVL